MKKWIKISIWTTVAIVSAFVTRGNLLFWLVGVFMFRSFIQMILTFTLAVVLYILFYLLIVFGMFGILIN